MAVQFVLGASGAGKTEYLYQTVIAQAQEHRDVTYYFIVPEQFSLETQKNLALRHPARGICNIDVISLARLAHQVFEELGGQKRVVLKDIGKSMVVRRILNACGKELSLFGANTRQSGFVEEVKSLLSELYQYGIGEPELRQMIEQNVSSPLLYKKLNDVLILYQNFQGFLGEHYLTSEGIYDILAECIGQSAKLNNCVIVMDGFTGFTPSQYALLRKLMQYSKKLYLSLTLEPEALERPPREHELFFLSFRSWRKVRELAREAGCEVLAPIFPDREIRQRRLPEGSMLAHLERNLFRYPLRVMPVEGRRASEEDGTDGTAGHSAGPGGGAGDLVLYAARDLTGECRFAATEAARLIREKGFRYRDIAVICSDINAYGETLSEEFSRAGLPNFLDYKKNLSENRCAEYVRSVLMIAERGITTDGVLSYGKNALSGYEPEDVWTLENYCISAGIRGGEWQREWKRTYATRTEVPLERLNALRERLTAELEPLVALFRKEGATVREWTTGLFYFLKEHGLEQKLAGQSEAFLARGERLRAREYAQLYRVLLELFDQLVELLGDEQLTAKEYRELVETGLHEAKVGLIPEGSEQIVIGDMERTRLKEIRALFFVGVNDGKIPAAGSARGIFNDKERRQLLAQQVELAPDGAARACEEQFYLYGNMTKPKDRLYLTYAGVGEDGKALRSSYLIGKVLALFPGLSVRTTYETLAEELVQNDCGRRAFLASYRQFAAGEAGEEFAGLYRWYAAHMEDEERERLWRAAAVLERPERLRKETARLLYGERILGSVTRLEQYASCAFAHFLQYGMGLAERPEYELRAPDVGNLYHDALQRFGLRLLARGVRWQDLSDEERDGLSAQCAREAVEEYAGDLFRSSARNAYLAERASGTLVQTLRLLTEQLRDSDFVPAGFEREFYHTDRNLSLYGKIDRYDLCETEGTCLVKIVDYKSGNRDFEPERLYYGLTMQLAVYMTAAMERLGRESGRPVEPAAMFYYHIDDPIVEKGGDVEAAILKKQRVRGLVNSDPEVIRHLDHAFCAPEGGLAASVKSLRIPVETGKEGRLGASSKVADRARFACLSEFVYDRLRRESEEILSGEARIAPFRLGKTTACDYCGFASVCGFDRKNGGAYRRLRPLTDDEAWKKMEDLVRAASNRGAEAGGGEGTRGPDARREEAFSEGGKDDGGA